MMEINETMWPVASRLNQNRLSAHIAGQKMWPRHTFVLNKGHIIYSVSKLYMPNQFVSVLLLLLWTICHRLLLAKPPLSTWEINKNFLIKQILKPLFRMNKRKIGLEWDLWPPTDQSSSFMVAVSPANHLAYGRGIPCQPSSRMVAVSPANHLAVW